MPLDIKPKTRLALVEDNQSLNAVLSEFLSVAGFDVSSYHSAEDVSFTPDFDIAILDLNLPGEDGLSLARRLKQIKPGLGVILLTIRSSLDDKLQGYEVGADVFLAKPVDPSELLAVINSLLKRLALTAGNAELAAQPKSNLTAKELDLLKCFAEGMSYADTGATLGVSLSTIQSHTRSLYTKLGAHSKLEAIQNARRLDLL